jgi:GTP pyrophosphokinase
MDVIQEFGDDSQRKAKETARTESLRKMLLAMVEDVRVVLVKLADRLHNLRTLKALPRDRQLVIARETLDIFAPLANRLGVWQLKWEMEDLSFRYLEPEIYKQIAAQLAERRVDRERYIQRFIDAVTADLERVGVRAEVSGRPKHIHSIWNKMKSKDLDFEHIFDIRGVRILTDSVQDCYAALGLVHTRWPHVAGEFDDYIATPKENDYQSIHTAVIGPEGKTVEVQLRTREMHERNELGVAAHWRYKEGGKGDESLESKVLWLRQLLEWKDEVADASEFVDRVKSEVFEDRVYVFTPKGSVIDLPKGATPIDFAYAIHTEVGHRCRGAKVNGRIVPLTYLLQTGQKVDVLTVKKGGPSRDWLSPHLGYTKTPKARSRIQRWFRQENFEQNIATGRQLLEREFQRLALSDVNLEKLARKLKFNKADEMFAKIAEGELKPSRAAGAAQDLVAPQTAEEVTVHKIPEARKRRVGGDFRIEGVGNLLTHIANCCNPLPGDPIVGYITQGRGVTIHRKDCHNILRSLTKAPERLVEVAWGGEGEDTYPIDIVITAYDRQGLLRDVSSVLADARINVTAVNTQTDKHEHFARMTLTVEVSDIDKLSQVLARLTQLPNVIEARRRMH